MLYLRIRDAQKSRATYIDYCIEQAKEKQREGNMLEAKLWVIKAIKF